MPSKSNYNLLLLLMNITSLSAFIFPMHNLFLILLAAVSCAPIKVSKNKYKMQAISVLSMLAAFISYSPVSTFFGTCALGLAMNCGYGIDMDYSSVLINSAMAVGILITYVFPSTFDRHHDINEDIILLTFTLPNLFLSASHKFDHPKAFYFLNPIYDGSWPYSLGFLGGTIFSQFVKIPKYAKMFCICFFLLVQTIARDLMTKDSAEGQESDQKTLFWVLLTFLRGMLIFSEEQHISELFFLGGFLLMKCLIPWHLVNYMLLGYLVIAVILWHQKPPSGMRNSNDMGYSGIKATLLDRDRSYRELNQGQN